MMVLALALRETLLLWREIARFELGESAFGAVIEGGGGRRVGVFFAGGRMINNKIGNIPDCVEIGAVQSFLFVVGGRD